jgi:hypothetical protein
MSNGQTSGSSYGNYIQNYSIIIETHRVKHQEIDGGFSTLSKKCISQ